MLLRDGVVGVRNKLGEGKAWLFDTNDIVRDLNTSARALCSEAQALRETYFGVTKYDANLKAWLQEYPMPDDCEFPYEGKLQVGGQMVPLRFKQQGYWQQSYAAGQPFGAYLRRGLQRTQQIAGGGEVALDQIPATGKVNWWVGFFPVPAAAYNFFIEYVMAHPQMTQPLDQCLIPEASFDGVDFRQAWEAYATARGKEKEGDLASAQYYDLIHSNGKKAFRDYLSVVQMTITPPVYDEQAAMSQPFAGIMAPSASNLTIEGS